MLNPHFFAIADVRWGPHTIDRFSPFKTRQIPRFSRRWLNPCMEYLDAFTASWSGENNWLFPPPCIIPRVLKRLQFSHANGTLVVPLWTSAPWWLLLTYDGLTFRPEVVDCIVIEPQPNILQFLVQLFLAQNHQPLSFSYLGFVLDKRKKNSRSQNYGVLRLKNLS